MAKKGKKVRRTMRIKKQRGGAKSYDEAPYIVKIQDYESLPPQEKYYYTSPQAYFVKVSKEDAEKAPMVAQIKANPNIELEEYQFIQYVPDNEKAEWYAFTARDGRIMYKRLAASPQAIQARQQPQPQPQVQQQYTGYRVYQQPPVYQPQVYQPQTAYLTQQPYYPQGRVMPRRQRRSRKN